MTEPRNTTKAIDFSVKERGVLMRMGIRYEAFVSERLKLLREIGEENNHPALFEERRYARSIIKKAKF